MQTSDNKGTQYADVTQKVGRGGRWIHVVAAEIACFTSSWGGMLDMVGCLWV